MKILSLFDDHYQLKQVIIVNIFRRRAETHVVSCIGWVSVMFKPSVWIKFEGNTKVLYAIFNSGL